MVEFYLRNDKKFTMEEHLPDMGEGERGGVTMEEHLPDMGEGVGLPWRNIYPTWVRGRGGGGSNTGEGGGAGTRIGLGLHRKEVGLERKGCGYILV